MVGLRSSTWAGHTAWSRGRSTGAWPSGPSLYTVQCSFGDGIVILGRWVRCSEVAANGGWGGMVVEQLKQHWKHFFSGRCSII